MKSLLLFLFLLSPLQDDNASAKLERLVEERQSLHAQWQASESKKSGIFGNRTKKDMKETNDWLERIISKDNQIVEELKLSGKIETAVIGQEKDDYKTITLSLEQDVQALKRAIGERDKTIEEMLSNRRTFEWTTLIFFLTTLGLGYWIYRSKKGA
ncbi:Clp protease ClpB [Algoriphagus sp. PAP.12]|uniref:Clp protease ClpB n=1 Tax=Algoriphagus sp. PAP.12 TaxID=2996678 RepID=UPI00227B29CE|nr:Clp protease ClpB [Algoriphagus sp. PAP.12]